MSAAGLLPAAMFFSGAAALLYETLFFRLSALALGNSTLAAAVVLAVFMGGLALGNLLAGRRGGALRRPVLAYQRIEVAIALSGFGLVVLLPRLDGALAPLFAGIAGRGALLDLARAAAAFVLMGAPATAMGATLPVLTEGAHGGPPRFGAVFGGLYAWNTLGAVAGALGGEFLLIPGLGLTGAGLVAAVFNCCSAALAAPAARAWQPVEARAAGPPGGQKPRDAPIVAAAAVAGFCFLSLEVVWFRYLQLFVFGSSPNFAVMLAVVLAGIGAGALAASFALRSREGSALHAAALLLAGGAAVPLGYRLFVAAVPRAAPHSDAAFLVVIGIALMLPLSLCSGALFPVLGQLVHRAGGGAARAAGRLTTANTAGAALGSLAAAFVLLPGLGAERSLLLLALLYGAGAALLAGHVSRELRVRPARAAAAGAAAAALACAALLATFPVGAVAGLLDRSVENFLRGNGERRVALVETPRETVQYLRKDLLGEPYYYRLVTDSYSMSTTALWARRYMRLFAALPLALRPDAADALLICYGCGTTARALAEAPQLRHIDIVDVSREIVELGRLVYPDERQNPARDPRATVHIEDGRFFLRTAGRRYDIITGEPPPPKAGHVVDLYTREYFRLMASRLADGGLASYWLPVHQLTAADTRAVARAFCDAFDECSLWMGDRGNWILLGTRGRGPRSRPEGAAWPLWADPVAAAELRAIGVASPAELGGLYIAGGERLRRWVGDAPPLTDDRPGRLSRAPGNRPEDQAAYEALLDPGGSWEDFSSGGGIAGLWPEADRRGAARWFGLRPAIDRVMLFDARSLALCLDDPSLGEQLLWVFGSDAVGQRILAEAQRGGWREEQAQGETLLHLAARAARAADPGKAATLLERALKDPVFAGDAAAHRKIAAMREVLAARAARPQAR